MSVVFSHYCVPLRIASIIPPLCIVEGNAF